jgi:hypothetical protein
METAADVSFNPEEFEEESSSLYGAASVSGPLSPTWKRGFCVHKKGYLMFTSGKDRGRLVHRVVIERLLDEGPCVPPPFVKGERLPSNFEIHHLDSNRQHNCPSNLLVLQDVIHEAIPTKARKNRRFWWQSK